MTFKRGIGFPRPQPSSGVGKRPLVPLLLDFVIPKSFVSRGQQMVGLFIPWQMAFDCRIYRKYAASLLSTNRTKSLKTAGHCLIFLQTPSTPFGSRHETFVASFKRDALPTLPVHSEC